MQAITIAISPAGIQYFTQQLINQKALTLLQGLKPPNKDISVPDFASRQGSQRYNNILVKLSSGSLQKFSPAYQKISQQAGDAPGKSNFVLTLAADNFSADYNWEETYKQGQQWCFKVRCSWDWSDADTTFKYQPSFGALNVNLTLAFVYQASQKSYEIQVVGTTSSTQNETANIPAQSVVNLQEQHCFSSNVSQATADAISALNFDTAISSIFPPLLDTIPASGNLTKNIVYDFLLGDSGLTFPNNSGIAIGVTGNATYISTPYSGETPPVLPLPPIPGDTHHLNVYVSNYAVNALHWAFYSDGKLNVNLMPSDLGNDAKYLRVNNYIDNISAFKPYRGAAIYAAIAPKAAPVTSFQQVYEFTPSVMTNLEDNPNLPNDVKQSLENAISGNTYVSKDDLEADLQGNNIAASFFATIETAAQMPGMVVTQTLEFTLTIQHGTDPKPNLIFDVARVDVMTKLGLGISGAAQTMQFGFVNVASKTTTTFVSTTVPRFDKKDFGDWIWPNVGEPAYSAVMTDMGQVGVPIPIMQGFQFLFEQAELSIQQGYVSILANVELTHQALPMQVRSMLAFAE